MASFVTEDGKGGISGDSFMMELQRGKDVFTFSPSIPTRKRHSEVRKIKIPCGRTNSYRLLNINMYDLLSHMQETLSLTNRCVIELITNEDHRCLNMNDTIQRHINIFANEHMPDSFREANPRGEIRIKKENDEYTTRPETDEEYNDRLCHLYMHQFHPARLQMIKCEECLQKWMNDDKW